MKKPGVIGATTIGYEAPLAGIAEQDRIMKEEEIFSAEMGKLSITVSPESKQAIWEDPFMSDWNNRLQMINKIYDRYCEEHEIPRYGTGDPPPFPQAVIDSCLQNGLLRYENGILTAMPE